MPAISFHIIKIPGAAVKAAAYMLLSAAWLVLGVLPVRAQVSAGFDEVPVQVALTGVGSAEMNALIRGDSLWLPLEPVFGFLKINNRLTSSRDSLFGFYLEKDVRYIVDGVDYRITVGAQHWQVNRDALQRTAAGLFLESSRLLELFGLDCHFNYRRLSCLIRSDKELPAERLKKQEALRKNLDQLRGEHRADTIVGRAFLPFALATADWSVTGSRGVHSTGYLRGTVALGGTLAGGSFQARLNYDRGRPMLPGRQYYRWRLVPEGLPAVKQVIVGRIAPVAVSSLFAPLNGIQVTTTPAAARTEFGTYRYEGNTEPGQVVELYVNNILIDYTRGDASGGFSFDIPLVYGSPTIELRSYGEWGEHTTRKEVIAIPYSFLPRGQFEYTASAGIVQDAAHSRYAQVRSRYGMSRDFTIGGGAEYFSASLRGRPMPFLTGSLRIAGALVVDAEYVNGVRAAGAVSYRRGNWRMEGSIKSYTRNQDAVRFSYRQERKASVALPIQIHSFSGRWQLSYSQYIAPKLNYSNVDAQFSTRVARIDAGLKTYLQFSSHYPAIVYSTLSAGIRLPLQIRLAPQVQYRFDQKSFVMMRVDADMKLSRRTTLTASYDRNSMLGVRSFLVGLRTDLSFAKGGISTRRVNGRTENTVSAGGSIVFGGGKLIAGSSNAGGTGGLIIAPFLDLDCNGRRDAGEPAVAGLGVRVRGRRVEARADSTLLVRGLEAYRRYLVELDGSSLDNISWQLTNSSISVVAQPDLLRRLPVPVLVLGEVSGMVYIKAASERSGLSGMIVRFADSMDRVVAQTLTEGDGYFSYLGLKPGTYLVSLDSAQLRLLDLVANRGSFRVTIRQSTEGVIADGYEFEVHSLRPVVTATAPDDQEAAGRPNKGAEKIEIAGQGAVPMLSKGNNTKPGARTRASTAGKQSRPARPVPSVQNSAPHKNTNISSASGGQPGGVRVEKKTGKDKKSKGSGAGSTKAHHGARAAAAAVHGAGSAAGGALMPGRQRRG